MSRVLESMMSVLERIFIAFFETVSWMLEKTKVYSLIRLLNRKKVIILMYHGVTRSGGNYPQCDTKHVLFKKFKWQLAYLKKKYSFISLQDYADWVRGEKNLPSNPVVLSFDDGYLNNYTVVYPLLRKQNIPAIIYLPSGMIDKKTVSWYDVIPYTISRTAKQEICVEGNKYSVRTVKEKKAAVIKLRSLLYAKKCIEEKNEFLNEVKKQTRVSITNVHDEDFSFMKWRHCRDMLKHSIIFGAHTHNHYLLAGADEKTLDYELVRGKNEVARRLDNCSHFSYPFGVFDDLSVDAMSKYYLTAVTTCHGWNTKKTNQFLLKRIPIMNNHTNWMFAIYLFWNVPLLHHWFLKKYGLLKSLFK